MTSRFGRRPNDPPVLPATDPDTVSLAASILLNGGVVAIPTDTVYGLAASLERPEAIDRIYDMKSRPTSKAIPVLVSEIDYVSRAAMHAPPIVTMLADRFWPGALTLVVEAREGLPRQVLSTDFAGRQTVAVRLPNHSAARQIISAVGGALAVTSANRSGDTEATTALQVRQLAIAEPDAIVDGGLVAAGVPSTIVSVVGSTIAILRAGAITTSEILSFLQGSGYEAEAFPGSAV